LSKTPKILGEFNSIIKTGLKVSFKLETQENILCKKITSSLKKYKSDLVIGNLLHTRYKEIFIGSLISQEKDESNEKINNDMISINKVVKKESTNHIEEDMVKFFLLMMKKTN
jgi:phosphopantothenate-cysteine ligase